MIAVKSSSTLFETYSTETPNKVLKLLQPRRWGSKYDIDIEWEYFWGALKENSSNDELKAL